MAIPHRVAFGSDVNWDGDQVTFNMVDDGRTVRCAVTRGALAAISGRALGRTSDVPGVFALWRDEVEALAWAKVRAGCARTHGQVVVTPCDTDEPPAGGSLTRARPETGLLQAA